MSLCWSNTTDEANVPLGIILLRHAMDSFRKLFRTAQLFRASGRLPASAGYSRITAGRPSSKRARVVNLSGTAALVKCAAGIPANSFVFIHSRELGSMGVAHVRHCEPLMITYNICLEFPGQLGLAAC